MAIAGGQKAGRRRDKGQHVPSTPADVGATLRDAREADGVTMADVHDRTGISWKHIEALESGDLSHFSDRRTALMYLGRYADLFGLDTSTLAPAVEEHWPDEVMAGARAGSADTGSQRASGAASNGHLSRFPGDRSHLLSFTQTAQVPGVRFVTPANVNNYDDAGALLAGREFTYFPPTRPAPLALRAAVWLTAMLVIVGGIGLAAHRYDPQLLVSMHLVKSPQGPVSAPSSQTQSTTATTIAPPVTIPTVVETANTANTAAVQVNATQYSVVLTPAAPVWTRVEVTGATAPLFEGTLQAGETKTFSGASGPLSVNLGAAKVTLVVQVSGKTVSGWSLTPPIAPYTVTFSPATN